MEYKVKLTRENIESSTLLNGDRNKIHHDSEAARKWLEGLAATFKDVEINPDYFRMKGIIVPGINLMFPIEYLEPIKDLYLFGIRDNSFLSPVVVEDKPKASADLVYSSTRKINDPPHWSYIVSAREGERKVLECEAFFTSKQNYEFVTKNKADEFIKIKEVSPDNSKENKIFIKEGLIFLKNDKNELYRNSIGEIENVNKAFYYEKNAGRISKLGISALLPAKLYNSTEGKDEGLYAFLRQSIQMLGGKGNEQVFDLEGISENLKGKSYNTSIKLKSYDNFLINSFIRGWKVA